MYMYGTENKPKKLDSTLLTCLINAFYKERNTDGNIEII